MTQTDLATKLSKPVSLIVDMERGTAPPDQVVLGKLENILKVHLRGRNIGQPKVFGPAKKAQKPSA